MSKKEQIAFRCSECSELFPKELVEEILKGKTVLCERCGFPFRSNFSTQDYKELGSPPIEAPILKRKETVAYSQPGKYVPPQKTTKKSSEQVPLGQKYIYQTPPKSKKKKNIEFKIDGSHKKEKVPENDIDSLKKAVRVMNDIAGSPLIIIIGILILAGTTASAVFTMTSDLYVGIMEIVVNSYRFILIILLWTLNYRIVIKPVRDESYTNLGIDAILLGVVGLPLYGLGVFMLFEGIFIMMYEIFIRHNNMIDLKKTDSLSEQIFAANFIESTIKAMNEILVKGTFFALLYSVIPILKKVRDFTPTPDIIGTLAFYGVFFVITFAYTIYLKVKFVSIIGSKPYQDVPEEIIVKCTVFSSFSLIYAGVGVLGLLTCIMLFIYRGIYRNIKKLLPSMKFEKPRLSREDATGISEKPTTPFIPVTKIPEEASPKSIPQPPSKKKETLQEIPLMRVDDKEARKQLISSLEQSEKQKPEPPPGKLPMKDKSDIKEYMDRVFTVLTADIRERLLKLDIPEDQKWDVIREFVNLKETQQQKYLEELENVNRVLSEELKKRVLKMKLPKRDTESILSQLEIMDPKEQIQFVEFLEHSQ